MMMGAGRNATPRYVSLRTVGWSPMDSSTLAQHAGTAGAVFASVFVVATSTMRTMIPLRIFGILTNLVLIGTSIPSHNYVVILVQAVVLGLNSYRLHQMLQLLRDVKKSVNSDLSMEWLKPFMTERKCAAGEVLFYKDEKAESMFYIVAAADNVEHAFGLLVLVEQHLAGRAFALGHERLQPFHRQVAIDGFFHVAQQLQHLVQPVGIERQQHRVQHQRRIIVGRYRRNDQDNVGKDAEHPQRNHCPHRKGRDHEDRRKKAAGGAGVLCEM